MVDKDYSLQALEKFLDYAGSKGLMKVETAKARKTASSRILSIADPAEVRDLREVDLDNLFERFGNLQGTDFKPASLKIYQGRVRSAIAEFVSYVNNPAEFRSPSASRGNGNKEGKKTTSRQKPAQIHVQNTDEAAAAKPNDPIHLVFPVPIRPDLVVTIRNLPHDLTPEEAKRIAAVVEALAVPRTK